MKRISIVFTLILIIVSLTSCVVHTRPASHRHTNVVYVKHAPKNHKIVIIKGKRYYYWNGKHHRKTKKGFVFINLSST